MAKVQGHDLKQVYFDPQELVLILWYEGVKNPHKVQCQSQLEADEFLEQIGWVDRTPLLRSNNV